MCLSHFCLILVISRTGQPRFMAAKGRRKPSYDKGQLINLLIVQDGLEGRKLCSPPQDGEKGNEDVNMGEV